MLSDLSSMAEALDTLYKDARLRIDKHDEQGWAHDFADWLG
eukprot:gene5213-50343_t